MKQITLTVVLFAISLAMLTGCAGTCKKDLESCRGQVVELQAQIIDLQAQKQEAQAKADQLRDQLRGFSEKEQLKLEELNLCTILRIPNSLVFASGSAELTKRGKELIGQVAEILKPFPEYDVQVRGHTDGQQIKPESRDRYYDNWELSGARSAAVVRFLVNEHKLNPTKMSAVGFGEYQPIASNDTAEGREENRRVEFYITPGERIQPLEEQEK